MNKRIIILVIVVVLFVIGFCGIKQKVQIPLPATPTPSVESVTSSVEENWETYHNERFSISFQYPVVWGTPTTSSFDIGATQEELDNDIIGVFPKRREEEIIQDGHSISFEKMHCTNGCDLGIQVREYSTSTPYELHCYEGECSATNLLEDQKYVENKANTIIGRVKWLCVDTYFPPGGNVMRRCRTHHGNLSFDLQMGYSLDQYQSFAEIMERIESGRFQMKELVGKMKDPAEFQRIEEAYQRILRSISFE